MPANRNALLRYKTIDRCLSNHHRRWSLEDLIEACSEALYEYEGRRGGISRRTIQTDLQTMRSDKLGYCAPIEVYDGKYYRYADPNYSITQQPLSEEVLEQMRQAVSVFAQFESFDFFVGITEAVNTLQDYLSLAQSKRSSAIIQIEQNKALCGLHWLSPLYEHIVASNVLELEYQSFRSPQPSTLLISPYLLKEYNNRWFLFGHHHTKSSLPVFALDRIISIRTNKYVRYEEPKGFDPSTYFDNVVGITKLPGRKAKRVRLWVSHETYPYMRTKPLHPSQTIEATNERGDHIIEIKVVINQELISQILSFGPGIRVLSPKGLVHKLTTLAHRLANHYPTIEESAEATASEAPPLERIDR